MKEKLIAVHGERFVDETLDRLRALLKGLYGEDLGGRNFSYLGEALHSFLRNRSDEDLQRWAAFDPGNPYANLDRKVFAICYADNVYDETTPTLRTLGKTLETYFPSINGIHILPERPMSHGDIWTQDFLDILSPASALGLVTFLQKLGILDENRLVNDNYRQLKTRFKSVDLPDWLKEHEQSVSTDRSIVMEKVLERLDAAHNSHFNDGGFSQKTRAIVDPRFGTIEDIKTLSQSYAIMLDFVVNHLDVDNDILEAFKRQENDGSAFIVITPQRYEQLKSDRILDKTFRPRPFPLFTGMRKYAAGSVNDMQAQVKAMNRCFEAEGLNPLDQRLIAFLSIYFKVRNDQGLDAADRRIFAGFLPYVKEHEIEESKLFQRSAIHSQQQVLRAVATAGVAEVVAETASEGIPGFLEALGISSKYAGVFTSHDDGIFGEKFFVYTTFSESQVDINPTSEAGFQLIIDDLFHLLSSGDLAMIRMDAVKYLWKEIGKKNFDMEEGNRLIEVIRLLIKLAFPCVLPLDEINSPDPVVYEMFTGGGFAYLFGPVNTVPMAFNKESLLPLQRFYKTMKEKCPENLVPFVMLSTHDGRSIQGLGIQNTDGHVTIEQFSKFKGMAEQQEGKLKYRSVAAGEIPADAFHKVCLEANLDENIAGKIFTEQSRQGGETLKLKDPQLSRIELVQALAEKAGRDPDKLAAVPAVDFFLEWIVAGKTPYELCCTARSAFSKTDPNGNSLSPVGEASRLALAQLYIMTLGQVVPAIYFNDLIGLKNDVDHFAITGRPRDLNRHKNFLPEIGLESSDDPFTSTYLKLINAILAARVADTAFLPGSRQFEFQALSDTVFLNHPYARDKHSFIVGNIAGRTQKVQLALDSLEGVNKELLGRLSKTGLQDALSGKTCALDEKGSIDLDLPPYSAVWLEGCPGGVPDGNLA